MLDFAVFSPTSCKHYSLVDFGSKLFSTAGGGVGGGGRGENGGDFIFTDNKIKKKMFIAETSIVTEGHYRKSTQRYMSLQREF